MGFISNQWLNRGMGYRARGYSPVPVGIECQSASGAWALNTGARVKITARRSNGEYQTVFLTQEEVDLVAEALAPRISVKAQERLLRNMLRVLSQAKLLRLLAFDLRDRVRLPKNEP